MMNGRKAMAALAVLAAFAVVGPALYANCQDQGGPYEVRQCANSTWFAPPPAGSGPISGAWWAVGYGNRTVTGTATQANPNGDGFTAQIGTNGVHHGVDSGSLPVYDPALASLDLVDATTIGGIGAPAGSLCFSSRANWGTPGIDSCIDVNRTATAVGGTGSQSDNYVNRYWDAAPTPPGYPNEYYVYLSHQLDPPIGVLLVEGTGKHFAAAFFATVEKRFPRDADLDPGQYHMGRIQNGLPSSTGPNVVPWQPIPRGNVSAVLSVPTDPASARNIVFDWTATPITLISDNSDRPCLLNDNATPCPIFTDPDGAGPKVVGVGVNNYGTLIRHEVERADLDVTDPQNPVCLANWTTVAGSLVDYPATMSNANGVAANSCVRLKTTFGKVPEAAYIASPINATNRDINRNNSQAGKLGDIGYFVVSDEVKVGGPLVSANANLRAVSKERNSLRVVFDVDTELNVTGFDVVGIDNKGGRQVLGTVACKQCTTGLSASYDELVSGVKLQGARKVQVVMQPSGTQSNTLDLK